MRKLYKIDKDIETILEKIDDIPKRWVVQDDYINRLKAYTRCKEEVFSGTPCDDYPFMSSFESKKDYLAWYGNALLNCLNRLTDEGELSAERRRNLGRMGTNVAKILGDYAFIPIIEEEVDVGESVVTTQGKVIKPFVWLPDDRKYPLL
ncbi:MAG: hypothetical protein CMH61_02410 [Nanoarchaeota archaeon]|mgnify:CR=1 FL=1|nr:hypothetical protein [Nanoarchaeota archaeon]|tara:strand:+ start:697 stop:1143 length:447 start_codon:yes stop_codon:yes gene_type:complete